MLVQSLGNFEGKVQHVIALGQVAAADDVHVWRHVSVHGGHGDASAGLDEHVGVVGFEEGGGEFELTWIHVVEHHCVRSENMQE